MVRNQRCKRHSYYVGEDVRIICAIRYYTLPVFCRLVTIGRPRVIYFSLYSTWDVAGAPSTSVGSSPLGVKVAEVYE